MYIKTPKNRFKYIGLTIIDLVCLNLAFVLAYWIYIDSSNPYKSFYRGMIIILCVANLIVTNLLSSYNNIEVRGYYKEFVALAKQTVAVFLTLVFSFFVVKTTHKFSRVMFTIMVAVFFILDYCARLIYKRAKKNSVSVADRKAMLIITELAYAKTALDAVIESTGFSYNIKGFVITESNIECDSIGGYPVVCSLNHVADYICQNWVDDVLIVTDNINDFPENVMEELSETGVAVHLALKKKKNLLGQRQFIESYAGYDVVTSCMNEATALEVFLKRSMDLIGGFFGCLLTILVFLVIAPIIKSKSPGPVLFRQKRVGKNGKVFTMYKFRSMYMNADEQKTEMAAANRVEGGLMFKLDFDPRIIGNVELPDGTRKTGIGDFIRRTSIDEFPQFFNVLKGEMSLVGTRPPTLDEWVKYDLHHRARLAIKPGITGMWQVSGRSEITDFEEVVALDTKYINEWSLGLDIKILMKTVGVVFKEKGAL